MDATLAAASALPGLAMTWLSGNTINVAVTEDPEGAETVLRQTWGGPLCVTTAEHTEAELNTISQELQAALPTLLTSGSMAADSIDAEVVFDDGSIQAWADETYGDGLVTVTLGAGPGRGLRLARRQDFSVSLMLIELMQKRSPVGVPNPSGKTWPRCEPHVAQRTSTRFMPAELSSMYSTVSVIGW